MKFVRVEGEGEDPRLAWPPPTDGGASPVASFLPPAMAPVYAVEIEPSVASGLLQRLNSQCPLPRHLEHVKRIWRRSRTGTEDRSKIQLLLLVCPIDGSEELEFLCREYSWQVDDLRRMEVPLRMPRTRSEYEHWRGLTYWPTTFHEPRTQLREQAEEAATIEMIGKIVLSQWLNPQRDVAIIVDPSSSSIVTVAEAGEATNLLTSEPIMIALTRVAKLQHAIMKSSVGTTDPSINFKKRQSSSEAGPSDDPFPQLLPYLCTNYVAYCTREPSIMAAMALIHSRIKAVIFRLPNRRRGGLVSKLRLHEIPTINHHFTVYHCVREEGDTDTDTDEERGGGNHK